MTVRLVNEIAMSAIQKSRNEDIDEAITILEEETQRRIEDIQQGIEFVCASLRAQGNTEINKMLMSVRELTVEEFCETYEANTQKFLEQQTQQRRGIKRASSLSLDTVADNSRKKSKPNAISIENDDTTSLKAKDDDDDKEANENVKTSQLDVLVPQNYADPLSLQQNTDTSQPSTQEVLPNNEPVVISIKRGSHTNLDIELHTQSIKEHFSVESAMERLNQLDNKQKSYVRSQIEDLQEKLENFKKGIL